MEAYNVLRPGFLEVVYQEALEIELQDRSIPLEHEKDLHVVYKFGHSIKLEWTRLAR